MFLKKIFLLVFISLVSLTLTAQPSTALHDVFATMKKVADWQIKELQTKPWKFPATDWTNASLYTGMMAWAKMANDDKYILWLKSIGDSLHYKGGPDRFFADDYCVGQTWSQLYMVYKDSAMIKPMISIGDDIIARPHTESLLWNFDGGLHNREWAWCDALYMGPPMLAYLSTATNQPKYLDIADKLWWRSTNYLYDPAEKLYFRDSRFFEKKEKNGAKVFWSRGNGWVIAGITRILENMPANYKSRKGYEKIFKDMAKRIAGLQQSDGTWHASMLDPQSYPIKESSGTAFFAYALAWGINNGYLSYKDYYPNVEKAWIALEGCLHEDGKLGFVQVPGAAPEAVTFEDTEVYGVGAFLLAGTELFKLQFHKDKAAAKVTVENTTAENRKAEMTEISWKQMKKYRLKADMFAVFNAQNGEEVPSQVIKNKKNKPVSVIFQSGADVSSTSYFFIKKQKSGVYPAKTFGRLIPERMDDFAWENDKVAFRMYGPALQKSGEISNGMDVWAKRTNALVIDRWYKSEDYHHDHGEGLDFYGVGTTLGAGGIAPYINNRLYPSENFVTYNVLANGPLRTQFELKYNGWNAVGRAISETKTITLDAGSFLNKVEIDYKFSGATLPVAIGLAIIPGEESKSWSKISDFGLLAYQEPAQENGSITTGIVLPQRSTTSKIPATDKDHYNHLGHYILETTVNKNNLLTYYQGASWNKEGTFKNFDAWKDYMLAKEDALKNPLKIVVTK